MIQNTGLPLITIYEPSKNSSSPATDYTWNSQNFKRPRQNVSEWSWVIQGPCYVISLKYTPLQSVSADPKYTFSKPCISWPVVIYMYTVQQ